MQTANRRTQTRSYQGVVIFVLAFAAAFAAVAALPTRAEQQAGYGLTTGLVGIVQGQTARLGLEQGPRADLGATPVRQPAG